MTNEQINIAIAEACGWDVDEERKTHGLHPITDGCRIYTELPDYCNDLNAMHEAEKVLTSEQVTSYVDSLEFMNERWATPAFGTAAQRAEAFLRTLGIWEE